MADSGFRVAWNVMQLMKRDTSRYWRPAELARTLSITRAEAELALFYLSIGNDSPARRNDGRWYWKTTPATTQRT